MKCKHWKKAACSVDSDDKNYEKYAKKTGNCPKNADNNCNIIIRNPYIAKENKVLKKALELACESILDYQFYDVSMTMYEGKWVKMIEDKFAYFVNLARGVK